MALYHDEVHHKILREADLYQYQAIGGMSIYPIYCLILLYVKLFLP